MIREKLLSIWYRLKLYWHLRKIYSETLKKAAASTNSETGKKGWIGKGAIPRFKDTSLLGKWGKTSTRSQESRTLTTRYQTSLFSSRMRKEKLEPIIDPLSPNPYAKNANDFKSVIYKPGEFVFCAVSDFNGKLFMEFGKIDGVIFNPNTENDPVYIVRFIDNTWARIEDPSFIAKAGSA